MCSIAENEDDIKPACPRAQGWPQKFRFIQHLLCSILKLNLSLIQANEHVHNLTGQGSLLSVPVDRLPLTRELQRTFRVKSEFLTNESRLYLRESILEYTRIKPRLENLGPVFILTLR